MKKLLLLFASALIALTVQAQHCEVKSKSGTLKLYGEALKKNKNAADFTAQDKTGKEVSLKQFKGKVVVISVIPLIGTVVCGAQTKRAELELTKLRKDIQVITISKDKVSDLELFCEAQNIKKHLVLSDIAKGEFGKKYGFDVKELNLLARGVVVINKKGKVVHFEYCKNITEQPDFDKVLAVLKKIK